VLRCGLKDVLVELQAEKEAYAFVADALEETEFAFPEVP
jgi:hypothetical protein